MCYNILCFCFVVPPALQWFWSNNCVKLSCRNHSTVSVKTMLPYIFRLLKEKAKGKQLTQKTPQLKLNRMLRNLTLVICIVVVGRRTSVQYKFCMRFAPHAAPIPLPKWFVPVARSQEERERMSLPHLFERKPCFPDVYYCYQLIVMAR